MEIRLIKIIIIIIFAAVIKVFAQIHPEHREEYTIVPIENILIVYNGNKLRLNDMNSENIQNILGKPLKLDKYQDNLSFDYDRGYIYKYKLLKIHFRSLEKEEWLHSIECSNPDIPMIVNSVQLFAGMKDSVLNVFEKSWEIYQKLENTKYYQDKLKRGDSTKTLIINFPIKQENYEYYGSIYIGVKDRNIVNINISLQDIDSI